MVSISASWIVMVVREANNQCTEHLQWRRDPNISTETGQNDPVAPASRWNVLAPYRICSSWGMQFNGGMLCLNQVVLHHVLA